MSILTPLRCWGWLVAVSFFPAAHSQAETPAVQLGSAKPLPKNLYGFNCDLLAATTFYGITFGGPEIENAVLELRPACLRFPGGTVANNYPWQLNSFSNPTNDRTRWAGGQIRLFPKT